MTVKKKEKRKGTAFCSPDPDRSSGSLFCDRSSAEESGSGSRDGGDKG